MLPALIHLFTIDNGVYIHLEAVPVVSFKFVPKKHVKVISPFYAGSITNLQVNRKSFSRLLAIDPGMSN